MTLVLSQGEQSATLHDVDSRLMRGLLIALGLSLVVGCAEPERIVRRRVAEDSWETLVPTNVQVRLGPLPDATLVLAQDGVERARGVAAVGTELPVVVHDVPCRVVVDSAFEDSSTDDRPSRSIEPGAPKPQPRDLRTQTWDGFIVTLDCGAVPVPGSDASLRGARPWPTLLWGLPALALGFVGGLHARPARPRIGRALLFGVLGVVLAGAGARWRAEDLYVVSYGALFAAWAVAGWIGGRLAEPGGRHTAAAWTAAAIAGPLALAIGVPAWGPGFPVIALLAGAVLATVGLVIGVSVKPTYGP